MFKINDEVTCLRYGNGVVVEIEMDSVYPVIVDSPKDGLNSYTAEGRHLYNDECPSLYHRGVQIIPAPEPERNQETDPCMPALQAAVETIEAIRKLTEQYSMDLWKDNAEKSKPESREPEVIWCNKYRNCFRGSYGTECEALNAATPSCLGQVKFVEEIKDVTD